LTLASVIRNVPAGAFELKRSIGDQLFDLAFAGRAFAQRLFSNPLGDFELTAFLTLVFVNRHYKTSTYSFMKGKLTTQTSDVNSPAQRTGTKLERCGRCRRL
jgi:hypothetical protein